jgi:transcription elongation factor Elf1
LAQPFPIDLINAQQRRRDNGTVRIHRCPRCRAEDISADAHPSRILDNGLERVVLVCRNCYRACELEFRIACQTADIGYVPLAIRDGLFALRDFYRARLAEYDDPAVLMDDVDRLAATRRIREALESVERRLAIAATDAT